jgi:hypothetical protein
MIFEQDIQSQNKRSQTEKTWCAHIFCPLMLPGTTRSPIRRYCSSTLDAIENSSPYPNRVSFCMSAPGIFWYCYTQNLWHKVSIQIITHMGTGVQAMNRVGGQEKKQKVLWGFICKGQSKSSVMEAYCVLPFIPIWVLCSWFWHYIREGELLFYTKIVTFSTKFCTKYIFFTLYPTSVHHSHPNFVDPMCSSVMQHKIVETLSNILAIY